MWESVCVCTRLCVHESPDQRERTPFLNRLLTQRGWFLLVRKLSLLKSKGNWDHACWSLPSCCCLLAFFFLPKLSKQQKKMGLQPRVPAFFQLLPCSFPASDSMVSHNHTHITFSFKRERELREFKHDIHFHFISFQREGSYGSNSSRRKISLSPSPAWKKLLFCQNFLGMCHIRKHSLEGLFGGRGIERILCVLWCTIFKKLSLERTSGGVGREWEGKSAGACLQETLLWMLGCEYLVVLRSNVETIFWSSMKLYNLVWILKTVLTVNFRT